VDLLCKTGIASVGVPVRTGLFNQRGVVSG
jgi:hypothetical protein